MDLSYCAASYFIEAICTSPTYSISYDYLKSLQSLVSREIAVFLYASCKNDHLYIFKMFPDVFVIAESSVCLTRAFLSVHKLKKSLTSNRKANSDYLETSALLYFNNILKFYGPQHFVHLFSVMANDYSQPFTAHFRSYSTWDIFNFFKFHSDVFLLNNEQMVYLIAEAKIVTNPLLNEKIYPEIIKKFKDGVYFLLTCFQSLHYLELKQCISYVIINAEELFDRHPLIKQREWFKNIPHTDMNELGFLSLKNFVSMPLYDTPKLILLIVCILAFEKKMHYLEIIKEVQQRIPSAITHFRIMSLEKQLIFFQQYSQLFQVCSEGNVTLLPSFVFPVCVFEASTFDKTSQNAHSELQSVVPYASPKNLNANTNVPVSRTMDINSQNGSDLVTLNSKSNGILKNNTSALKADSKDLLSLLKLSETAIKRVKISISYLWKYAKNLDYKRTVRTIIYVLNDVEIPLCSWSAEDQHNFIAACCQFMDVEPYKKVEFISPKILAEIENEKMLLMITYCLSNLTRIHFEKIVMSLKSNGIDDPFLFYTTREQFMYFRNLPEYIKTRQKSGNVRLRRLPDPLRSVVESYFEKNQQEIVSSREESPAKNNLFEDEGSPAKNNLFEDEGSPAKNNLFEDEGSPAKNNLFEDEGSPAKNNPFEDEGSPAKNNLFEDEGSLAKNNLFEDEESITKNNLQDEESATKYNLFEDAKTRHLLRSNKSINRNDVSEMVLNEKCVKSSSVKNKISNPSSSHVQGKIPQIICKILHNATHLFRKYVKYAAAEHVLAATIISLDNLYEYFCSLSVSNQYEFVEDCYQFIQTEALWDTLTDVYQTDFGKRKEHILFIVYILSEKNNYHFEKIAKRLKKWGFDNPMCKLPIKYQFKYFKEKPTYFMINSDGYVTLESSMHYVTSAIATVKFFIPDRKGVNGEASYQSTSSPKAVDNLVHHKAKLANLSSNDFYNQAESTRISNELQSESKCIESEIENVIIDLCFHILSVSKTMCIEKLCYRLNSCNVKSIHNFFSFFTVSEKLSYFKELSQYFDVSKDGFVSLKENIIDSYVPKTKLNSSELFNNNISPGKSSYSSSCDIESVRSTDFSESVDSCSSNGSKKRRRGPRRRRRALSEYNICNTVRSKVINSKARNNTAATSNNIGNSRKSSFSKSTFELKTTVHSNNINVPETKLNLNKFTQNNRAYDSSFATESSGIQTSPGFTNLENKQDTKLVMSTFVPECTTNSSVEKNEAISHKSVSADINHFKTVKGPFKDKKTEKLGIYSSINDLGTPSVAESSPFKDTLNISNSEYYTSIDLQIIKPSTSFSGILTSADIFNVSTSNKLLTSNMNFDSDAVQCETSHRAYISELVDSFVENLKFDCSTNNTSDIPENQKIETYKKFNSPQQMYVNNVTDSYHIVPNVQNLSDNRKPPLSAIPECSSHLENSVAVVTKRNSGDFSKELRAVNFFSVVLKNYSSGIPVEFLKNHLHLASLEVQNLIHNHFEHNFASFFLKYRKVFYVSPQTNNVYLIKKSN